ncbi:hypothetical protein F5Y02DRAFT_48353 [Annulohypoxylon stygium]|nr:hypothetical protein F5Y02DRAFT_48353 [Annulohypoxylon stygium]
MSSSETNSENSPHSTVLCATTKTKHARTVGRSVTANMIVPKSRISLPTSFAVSAATPATWPEIALIGRRVRTGEATVPHVLLDVSALETPLIANMSNSCKSSEEALADPQLASRQVLVPTAMAPVTRSPGSAVRQVLQLLGALVTMTRATKAVALRLLGATAIVVMIITEVITMAARIKISTVAPRRPDLHLGIKPLPDSSRMQTTLVTRATARHPAWDRLRVSHLLEAPLVHLLVYRLVILMPLSSSTLTELHLLRRRLLLAKPLPLLPATNHLLLPLVHERGKCADRPTCLNTNLPGLAASYTTPLASHR